MHANSNMSVASGNELIHEILANSEVVVNTVT